MPKYRKNPLVIEATQWFQNGDHPRDDPGQISPDEREGTVVRYYRYPMGNGQNKCEKCGGIMHNHGWTETLEGGHIVCPGDWIITGVAGKRYPCKPDIFEKTYDGTTGAINGVPELPGISASRVSNIEHPTVARTSSATTSDGQLNVPI